MQRMKVLKYITITAGLLLTASCNDLDLAPLDYNGSGNFWKNEAQVVGAIEGAHNYFRGNDFNYWLLGEARGGTMIPGGTSSLDQNLYYSDLKSQNISAKNPQNSSWFGFYGDIFNVNNAIKNIEDAGYLSAANKSYYLGQMYGMRAWYYFWLYRTYGGVPIKTGTEILDKTPTSGEELFTARSTPKATLDFIKADINKSETHFTNSNKVNNFDRIHWSYYATLMLKAEIYLWSAKVTTGDQTPAATDLATAKAALDKVVNSGKFSLMPNYADVFDYKKKQNSEIIFAMANLENESSTPFSSFMYYPANFHNKFDENGRAFEDNDPLKLQGGLLFNEYKFELFEAFDATDTRRAKTFLSFYSNAAKTKGRGIALIKYIGFTNTAGTRVYADDIPVYRYADALLMYAEIVNKENGDPSAYINEIRKRAYGANYTSANAYTHTDFAAGELAILKERDKEFVAESKRWFDVLRLQDAAGKPLVFSKEANYGKIANTVQPILNEATEAYKVLWPINKDVMNRDKDVAQTPGYTE